MNDTSIAHALVGFDPDAVVCSCGRRFEFSEWGCAAHAKEIAEQHAKLATDRPTSVGVVDESSDPLRDAILAATPAWADPDTSRVVYGPETDATFVSRDLARKGSGMKILLDSQAFFRAQADGTVAANQSDTRVVSWIGVHHDYVELPVKRAVGAAVDLLLGVAAADHLVRGKQPTVEDDLDVDGSLLSHSITFESDCTRVTLVNDEESSDGWHVYVNVSDLEGPLDRGRDLLRMLATAIAVGEQLNAEGTATS